ncbi:penicillin-binding transpeptidase domain-containing protein [Streptomyces sp. NBC_01622]|uniref:hypothetical protein n=1 Tax=Streptomyces sp. NBC_01622 TaxID=2975903 RepID=UPI0038671CE0|nr:penicillin-binding transpeptidase domain-containing protein [Streptomyces sp. NBC_01622]
MQSSWRVARAVNGPVSDGSSTVTALPARRMDGRPFWSGGYAAVKAGLLESSMAPLEQTFPIGTSTPSAIRTADAYATFANSGKQNDPCSVTGVLRHGKPVGGLQHPDARAAFTPGVAAIVDKVLQGVAFQNGTQTIVPGSAPVATGADDLTKSARFMGYDGDFELNRR